jgi:FtsP/CotA-like multicopper oxidase with cupredoxin domain
VPRRTALLMALMLLIASGGCVSSAPQPPDAAGTPLRNLLRAVDTNPDPHVFETELTAAPMQYAFVPGKPTTVLAYNGSFPGPLIECNQGDELVVHFTNHLSEPTTVHWHGVRLPAAMDGSHLSQDPVPPGGTFTYRFTVPDAALFWYHPHHNAQQQLYRGLYGALLVHGPGEPQLTGQRVVMLSDIGLDAQGQVIDPDELSDTQLERALGVEGNTLLVNGQIMPSAAMQPGALERWRVVNACTARYYRLGLGSGQLTLLGTDGGLIDKPAQLPDILLAPGERADLAVPAPGAAQTGTLLSLGYQRLRLGDYQAAPATPIATLYATGPAVATPVLPAALATIPAFETSGLVERPFNLNSALDPPVEDAVGGRIAAAMDGHDMGGGDGDGVDGPLYRFTINRAAFPDIPRFTVPLGSREVWVLRNHSGMDHPFHLHGFRFQVLDVDGVAPLWRGWKDTVNISETAAGDQVIRLLVDFDGQPGEWVYHCHVIFHQEHGMMGEFTVQ